MSERPRPPRWVPFAQVAVSVAVLGVLIHQADLPALGAALRHASAPLLAIALLVKAFSITLHEVRLWLALPAPRPRLWHVVSIGYAAGALNLVLPGRGGDLAAMAMLNRECEVSGGTAAAAVGIIGFLEAAVFGVLLLIILIVGAARWEQVVGEAARHQALQWVAVATLGGVLFAIALVVAGRLLTRRGGPRPAGRALGFLHEAITATSQGLSDPGPMLGNIALAIVQVLTMIVAMSLALPAVGIHIELPWLAASGVLAISSFAAILLPPSYGAGPAAASVAVLSVFGVSQAEALAYAVAWWLLSQVPAVTVGLPSLWGRRWK